MSTTLHNKAGDRFTTYDQWLDHITTLPHTKWSGPYDKWQELFDWSATTSSLFRPSTPPTKAVTASILAAGASAPHAY